MSIARYLDEFIKENEYDIFIEAEGRPSRLRSFYQDYNNRYNPTIDDDTDGIIALDEDANKWGLELRLYLHHKPDCVDSTRNTVYRSEYSYRINDTEVISEMFDLGYRIGLNNAW